MTPDYYNVPWVPKSLHAKQDLDPFSRVYTAATTILGSCRGLAAYTPLSSEARQFKQLTTAMSFT